ncbi:MAG: hypothetical protein ACRDVG_03410 [Jatrophihabitantaceae bacterium]
MNPRPGDRPASLAERAAQAGVDVRSAVILGVALVLLLAAYSVLPWFRDGAGFFAGASGHSTFGNVHDLLESTQRNANAAHLGARISFGGSKPFFGWLGWLFLLACAAAGAVAVSRQGRHFAIRWLGAVLGASGAAFAFLALNLVTFEGNAPNNANAPDYGDYIAHSSLGAWAAIVGYLGVTVACLLRRSES